MPPPTDEATKRLKTLVTALTRQTHAGRLSWRDRSPSHPFLQVLADREVFDVSLPQSTITITSRPGITVTGRDGEPLQEYMPAMVEFGKKDANLEQLLRELLKEIREQQRRALSELDDIIADVEGLGDSSS